MRKSSSLEFMNGRKFVSSQLILAAGRTPPNTLTYRPPPPGNREPGLTSLTHHRSSAEAMKPNNAESERAYAKVCSLGKFENTSNGKNINTCYSINKI